MTPLAITTFFIPAKFWLCGLVLLLPWHSDHLLLSKNNRYSFICSICWSTEPSWRSPGHHSHCQEKTGDIVTYLCWRARTPGLTQSWCPPRSLHDCDSGMAGDSARPAGHRRPQHQLLSAEEFHVIMIRYFQNRKSDFL